MAESGPWTPVRDALLEGKTIRIPGHPSWMVTGQLSKKPGIRHKYKVNVRTTPAGVVTWLTPKEV